MYTIERERRQHAGAIEQLLDVCFGPDRFQKTVYKLRDGVPPDPDLCFVAFENGVLKGSLRFWPVLIAGRTPAIMLGPLAVDPAERGKGIGIGLMEYALAEATRLGHRICILVGDEPYYARVGFAREGARDLQLPGWVDENRFLARALVPGALDGLSGMVERVDPPAVRRVATR